MPRDGEKWWTNNAANVTKASCDAAAGICPARPRLPFVFLPTDHFPVTTCIWRRYRPKHRQHKAFLFHAACELGLRNKVEALRKESLIFLPALLQEAVAHADSLVPLAHSLVRRADLFHGRNRSTEAVLAWIAQGNLSL